MSTAHDPADDQAFTGWMQQWTDGTLGGDKDEGLGLLWKEGLFSELLGSLYRRAPRTMAALAARLAKDAPELRDDGAYIPRRLLAAYLDAMALPPRARTARLDELELTETRQDLADALRELEPPMSAKYRHRLESWLDMAAGIEARSSGATAQPPATLAPGARVRHPELGPGTVTAIRPGPRPLATVEFELHGSRKLLASFLEGEG